MTTRRLLRPYVSAELGAAIDARKRGEVAAAWQYVERAHILSQPSAWLHTRVHWAMLVLALRTRDLRELAGQLVRIAVAGVGSALGRYPRGNTGRARVPLTEPMPIADDLEAILRRAERPRDRGSMAVMLDERDRDRGEQRG